MSSTPLAADLDTVTPETETPASVRLGAPGLVVACAIVALADWLFYGHTPAIALVVFILALAAGALAVNAIRAGRGRIMLAACILAAGQLPYAVNPSILSLLFSVAAVALFAVLLFANTGPRVSDAFAAARSLALSCIWRGPVDIRNALVGVAARKPKSTVAGLVVWFLPVSLGAVFAVLFIDANPLIASWVSAIDLRAWFGEVVKHLDPPRITFWLLVTMLVWPFIFAREYRRRAARQRTKTLAKAPLPAVVGKAAILRSLIVFNGLFAVQTVLDALYLWGGVALPDGMTYAEYAHRGAYPLILTALLAAAFVIIALKPGSDTERTPIVRALVCIWIAQNVWLVISSILRLDLYVATYSLTYMRIAAFVWMLLVAVGLALILARIVLGRSNSWLIGANLVSLTLTLYVCAFPNFASIIAGYNVAHSAEMGGGGPALDRTYLRSLGRHAIPAADAFLARTPDLALNQFSYQFPSWRVVEAEALRAEMQDWRAWNYCDWRLLRYLDPAPTTPSPTDASPATP